MFPGLYYPACKPLYTLTALQVQCVPALMSGGTRTRAVTGHDSSLTHLLQLAQLLWQLLYVVAVKIQPVQTGQVAHAGRHHCQLVL